MKSTGITRRIDDLGRIVIPKEIRKNLKIKENEVLEIFINNDEKKLLQDNYNLISKEELSDEDYAKYIKKYPELANEEIYELMIYFGLDP